MILANRSPVRWHVVVHSPIADLIGTLIAKFTCRYPSTNDSCSLTGGITPFRDDFSFTVNEKQS